MITLTKIKFSKKDAKILISLLAMANRELRKNLEDRSETFDYLTEEDVKRFTESINYKLSRSRTTSLTINMMEVAEE